MSNEAIVTVFAVFAFDAEARTIGREMVERRLAACVNILGGLPLHLSLARHIEEAKEVAALFKTGRDKVKALAAAIGEMHSYETPAIVVWPIEAADPAYRAWVIAETR